MVLPTVLRKKTDPLGHRPPMSFRDDAGTLWKGTSRIVDRAGRRHDNKVSWARMKAEARRSYVNLQRARAVVAEAEASA